MVRAWLGLAVWLMPALAWADTGLEFYADPGTGCRVGVFATKAPLSVRWSGPCVAGKAEGSGVAEFQYGGTFYSRQEGAFHAGLAEGRGIRQLPDRRQEAEFRGGRMNGRCVTTLSNGTRVDGQCVNDLLTGPGKAEFDDGSVYEGDFRESTITGKGVWKFANGGRYEGDFVDAKLNGRGRAVYSVGESYEGDYVNGDYDGQGVYHFADGSVYEGEWSRGKPNGRGTLHGFTHGLLGTFARDFSGTWLQGCFRQGEYTAHVMVSAQDCGFGE